MNEVLQKITDSLNDKLENFQTDEKELLKYLEFQSRFYQGRSFRNSLLIFMKKPDAEIVATYKQWKNDHNRIVVACIVCRAFAKAKCECIERQAPTRIDQLRPIFIETSEKENEKEKTSIYFRNYFVFDISDTEPLNDKGLKVINPNSPIELTGSSGKEILILASIFIEKQGWKYTFQPTGSNAKGYTDHLEKEIRISNNMETLQQAKTTIHELAHFNLHSPDDFDYLNCRDIAEVQAESVAYTVLRFLGLDSSEYSVRYIIGWANNDLKLFRDNLKDIVETSQKIINDLQLTEGQK